MTVEIYDYCGQRIYFVPRTPKGALSEIDLSDKSNGIYLIRILNNKGALVGQKKVVKAN